MMVNKDEEFDEELIDISESPDSDESEGDEEEAYGFAGEDGDDDEGEDEEEPADVRAALLAKHEMIALLSLRTMAGGGRIVRIDPRQPAPAAKSYEDPAEAQRWFRRSLLTSQRNGWRVIYDGEPLFG